MRYVPIIIGLVLSASLAPSPLQAQSSHPTPRQKAAPRLKMDLPSVRAQPPTRVLTPVQQRRLAYYEHYVTPAIANQRLRLEQALSPEDHDTLARVLADMRRLHRQAVASPPLKEGPPAMASQGLRLEQALSPEDQDTLARMLADMRRRQRPAVASPPPLEENSPRSASPQPRQEPRQIAAAEQRIVARLDPLIAKHQVLIADIAQQLTRQKAQWLKDLAKYPPPRPLTDQRIIEEQTKPILLLAPLDRWWN